MSDLLDDFKDIVTVPPAPPDVPPENPPDETVDGPTCEECGTPIEWSGRGRKPKRCSLHKTRTTPRDSSSGPLATRKNAKFEARLEQLREDLLTEAVGFGHGLSKVLPTAGVTVVRRADRTVKAMVRIAQDNPRILDKLEVIAKVAPGFELGETAACVGVALLVDMGRIHQDSMPSVMLGVSATWHEINDGPTDGQIVDQEGYAGVGFPPVSVPPRFEQIK